ncbi:hypothetical protein HWV62_29218 [Athelia sp. TMB]|nr:hypothetical protein HWV62_29218 [Athelia sp. TMB]
MDEQCLTSPFDSNIIAKYEALLAAMDEMIAADRAMHGERPMGPPISAPRTVLRDSKDLNAQRGRDKPTLSACGKNDNRPVPVSGVGADPTGMTSSIEKLTAPYFPASFGDAMLSAGTLGGLPTSISFPPLPTWNEGKSSSASSPSGTFIYAPGEDKPSHFVVGKHRIPTTHATPSPELHLPPSPYSKWFSSPSIQPPTSRGKRPGCTISLTDDLLSDDFLPYEPYTSSLFARRVANPSIPPSIPRKKPTIAPWDGLFGDDFFDYLLSDDFLSTPSPYMPLRSDAVLDVGMKWLKKREKTKKKTKRKAALEADAQLAARVHASLLALVGRPAPPPQANICVDPIVGGGGGGCETRDGTQACADVDGESSGSGEGKNSANETRGDTQPRIDGKRSQSAEETASVSAMSAHQQEREALRAQDRELAARLGKAIAAAPAPAPEVPALRTIPSLVPGAGTSTLKLRPARSCSAHRPRPALGPPQLVATLTLRHYTPPQWRCRARDVHDLAGPVAERRRSPLVQG